MKLIFSHKRTVFAMLAAAAMFLAVSCTDETADAGVETERPAGTVSEGNKNLTTVKLATFAGNQSRVTATRAEEAPQTLRLIASIENPSKEEGFRFIKEEGGRYLSATSVYYDSSTTPGTYYATYHMQGNNYNTTLDNEIGGAIQSFTIADDGAVTLGDGFRAENPDKEDFDFNHLYFDVTDKRIVAVGHKWNVPSTWTGEGAYTGKRDNTRAIIGLFNPESSEFTYSTINTSEKELDDNGKSLGYKDAGDANCVIRAGETQNKNHTYGWDFYYVATRKGMAVVHAEDEALFKPVLDENGINYFIPTPGSAKFVAKTGESSYFDLLYLAEDKSNDSYTTSSEARIAHFSTQTGEGNTFGYLRRRNVKEVFNPQEKDILDFEDQTVLPEVISPIDGKNTLLCAPESYSDIERYAALGTGGMYYHFNGVNSNKEYEGVVKFGNLPVNCVTADTSSMESGHDGFIYVACGSRLVILHRRTFELVAYWNLPSKDENDNYVASSANYIHVEKGPENNWAPRERIITVAFGQAGLKVFKFSPATLEKKTVWEKELPSEILCH